MRTFFLVYTIIIYIITVVAFVLFDIWQTALIPFALAFWGIYRAEKEARKVFEARWVDRKA